jgi:hypothetical protein
VGDAAFDAADPRPVDPERAGHVRLAQASIKPTGPELSLDERDDLAPAEVPTFDDRLSLRHRRTVTGRPAPPLIRASSGQGSGWSGLRLGRARDRVDLGMLSERVDDRPGFVDEGRNGPAGLAESRKTFAVLNDFSMSSNSSGVEQMGHEAGVLVHDVRPEPHDLAPVELGLTPGQRVKTTFPALGLLALTPAMKPLRADRSGGEPPSIRSKSAVNERWHWRAWTRYRAQHRGAPFTWASPEGASTSPAI